MTGWTQEKRQAQSERMIARHAAAKVARQQAATPAPAAPTPPPPAPPHPLAPAVTARTIWQEAEDLLLAGLSVVDVARDCDLPKGQVSALKFRLQEQRGS